MKLGEMRAILADHDDFKNEKCRVDTFLSNSGHTCVFIPKFHCELNPIERVWSQSKRYTRAYCDYTIVSLRRSIPLGLGSVTKENIANYVRRCRNYMFAYLESDMNWKNSTSPLATHHTEELVLMTDTVMQNRAQHVYSNHVS